MDCYQCYCIDFLLFVDGHCCHRKYCIAALRSLYTFRQLAWLNMNEALYNWDGFHCHCKTAVSSSMSMYGHHYCCSTALLAYTSNRMVHQVNRGNSFQNELKFTQNPVFLFFSNRNKVEEISFWLDNIFLSCSDHTFLHGWEKSASYYTKQYHCFDFVWLPLLVIKYFLQCCSATWRHCSYSSNFVGQFLVKSCTKVTHRSAALLVTRRPSTCLAPAYCMEFLPHRAGSTSRHPLSVLIRSRNFCYLWQHSNSLVI